MPGRVVVKLNLDSSNVKPIIDVAVALLRENDGEIESKQREATNQH
jgi:hypothetical protein